MKDKDHLRFAKAMTALADYYGRPLSDGSMGLYWQGLQGYDIDQVEKAIGLHLQNPDTGQFMPKIADIVRMLEGTTQDAAALAWAKVMRAVGSVGMHESLVFDDPIIHLVIDDLTSWPALCQTSEAELPFLAKRFETSYRAYRRRGEDLPPHPRYLVGLSEIANVGTGYKADPPRLVGDPEKAKRVLLNGSSTPRLLVTGGQFAEAALRLVHRRDAA